MIATKKWEQLQLTVNNSKSEEGQGDNSVHFPLLSVGGGRGLNLQPNIRKTEDLTGPQFLERGCWKKGGNLFQWGIVTFT